MGHELVREQHRLGVLHVGTAGHDGLAGLHALLDQCVDEVNELACDHAGVAAQPHADEAGDLIVAGTACAQFAAEFVAGDVDESAFKRGGLILVVFDGGERAVVDGTLQFVERRLHAVEFVVGEQAGSAEGTRVGAGACDVVVGETPVELGGLGEFGQCGGRAGGETAAPQGQMFVVAFSHAFYLNLGRGKRRFSSHHVVWRPV